MKVAKYVYDGQPSVSTIDRDCANTYTYTMIGLAFLIAILAIIVALVRKSRYRMQVVILAILVAITYTGTLHFTNQNDPNNPFAAIGPAIIGSVIALLFATTGLILSFIKRQ